MNVFDLFARISLDSSDYRIGLSEAGATAVAFAKATIDEFAKVGKAFAGLAQQSLDSYSQYEQLVGGVDTLFKDSSQKVQEYAANAYKTAGLSANEYMEQAINYSASLIQGLGGDTEKAADIADMAIKDMSDNVNKMGTTMEMAQNAYRGLSMGNFMMLDNLKLGYQGTAAEMARLINDSGVMGESFEATAKNVKEISFDKYIEAIHVIQQQMGITGTTAEEAADTIEGSTRSMAAAWQNLVTEIAKDDADMDGLIDSFVVGFETAANNIVPRIGQIAKGIGELIKKVSPVLVKLVPTLLNDIVPVLLRSIGTIISSITQMLPQFAPELVHLGASLLGQLWAGMASENGEGESFFTAFVDELLTKLPYMLNVGGKIIAKLAEGMLSGVGTLLDGAVRIIEKLASYISEHATDILGTITDIIIKITKILTKPETITSLIRSFTTVITAISKALLSDEVLGSLLAAAPEVLTALLTAMVDSADILAKGALDILSGLVDWFTGEDSEEHLSMLGDAAVAILSALGAGLEGAINVIWNVIAGPDGLAYRIADFFGIGDYWQAGYDSIEEFKNGVSSAWDAVKDFFSDVGESIYDRLHPHEHGEEVMEKFNHEQENAPQIELTDEALAEMSFLAGAGGNLGARTQAAVSSQSATDKVAAFIARTGTKGVPSGMTFYGDGGIVTKPTIAMIGEDGAEAVVPLEKDSETGRMFGGVTITFGNIYVQGGENVGNEVVRQIDEALRMYQIQQTRGIGGAAWQR